MLDLSNINDEMDASLCIHVYNFLFNFQTLNSSGNDSDMTVIQF